ncbi:ACT domain-containing protein [Chryseomicrobium palamuruense]|uniref:ACT domain-containing protein n=1 Tax=Chryseomicrobium palamuruense TaxID=682973 RepID=A0ABV8URB8_9BACL
MSNRTITMLIKNPGHTLVRLTGLVNRHRFSLRSLLLEETDTENVSKLRLTVAAEDEHRFVQLFRVLDKQLDVVDITVD